MLEWWQSIVLGIVEGLTEFLPISSTGHLTIAEAFLGLRIDDPTVTAYTAIIQIGAMIASIVYFRSDIVRIAGAWFAGLRDPARRGPDFRLGWAIIAGFSATVVISLALKDVVEGPFRSLWFVVVGLIGWSAVMFLADRKGTQHRGEDSFTWKDGLIVGLMQCVALVPGVSRSGATISAALLLGLDRVTATRFSFFLGIPTLIAAGGFQAVTEADAIGAPGGVGWAATLIGIVVSGVVAYVAIAWLLKFVATNDFTVFVIYRIIVGLLLAAMLWQGMVPA